MVSFLNNITRCLFCQQKRHVSFDPSLQGKLSDDVFRLFVFGVVWFGFGLIWFGLFVCFCVLFVFFFFLFVCLFVCLLVPSFVGFVNLLVCSFGFLANCLFFVGVPPFGFSGSGSSSSWHCPGRPSPAASWAEPSTAPWRPSTRTNRRSETPKPPWSFLGVQSFWAQDMGLQQKRLVACGEWGSV